MIEAYKEAVVHYEGISQANRDTSLGYTTTLLAVEASLATKDTQGGIDILNAVINTYKDAEMQASALMNIALIHVNAKDYTKAKETLQRLIIGYPKSRLVKMPRNF